MSQIESLFGDDVQTSAGKAGLDILELDVESWVDLDPQVEIVLRRSSDGLRIVLCPNKASYQTAIAAGEVAFTPAEVKRLAALGARGRVDAAEARAFVARLVDAKRVVPGIKLAALEELGQGGQA